MMRANVRCTAAFLCVFCVACEDDTLTVRFAVPPAFRERVTSVVLHVHEQPASEPFLCDDVAFANVDATLLRASLVAEVTVGANVRSTPIGDLDRRKEKLFVVEAREEGAAGKGPVVVAKGCAQHGADDDTSVVEIRAEPTTRLEVERTTIPFVRLGDDIDRAFPVTVVDARAEPISGIVVKWMIVGSGDSGSTGSATTDASGVASIRAMAPARPGPFAVELRARWGESPAAISGFVAPNPERRTFEGRALDYRTGRIGPGGEPGLVALVEDTSNRAHVVFAYTPKNGALVLRSSPAVIGYFPRLGIIDFRGAGIDHVIVVTEEGWNDLSANGENTKSPFYEPPSEGEIPLGIAMAGACSGSSRPVVWIPFGPNLLGAYDPEGRLLEAYDPEGAAFLESGCLSTRDGTLVRSFVVDYGRDLGLALVFFEPGKSSDVLPWLAVGYGISFAPPVGGGPSLLLATQIDVNDFVVSRLFLERSDDAIALVVDGVDIPPGVPLFTVGGDVDADGKLDVASLVRTAPVGDKPAQYAIWTVIGKELDGRRIHGTFDIDPKLALAPELALFDFDGDGYQDLVVGERPALTEGDATTTTIELFPMGPH